MAPITPNLLSSFGFSFVFCYTLVMELTQNQHQVLQHLYDNRDGIGVDHGNLLYMGRDMENVDAVIEQLTKKGLMCEDWLAFYFITPEGEHFFK